MIESALQSRPDLPARRSLHGLLLLDKAIGITSQTAVSRVKRLLWVRKAGHTGTLDPLATGLLPICVGEATKFSHLLLEAEKSYEATIRLGITTTTGDLEGETTSASPVNVDRQRVQEVLTQFIGEIDQVPPMFSALKHRGRPLYELARQGITVPRAARRVHVPEIALLELDGTTLRVRVTCGKGTYVRVLAEDIGKVLGCGAALAALRRTTVGDFHVSDAVSFDRLEELPPSAREAHLLCTDAPLVGLPRVDLDAEQAHGLIQGRPFQADPWAASGLVRLYEACSGRFLGVGMRGLGGRIAPRRLLSDPAQH
jgi:tRNA pseudouridine55 synthase